MEEVKEDSDDVDWWRPTPEEKVKESIANFAEKNISYGKNKILGFPGTCPHELASEVYGQYICEHPNNIGLHTNTKKSEAGFKGTQKAEGEVIAMLADLMKGYPKEIDGYISPGGTEANIMGCWIGRDAIKGEKTAIVCSFMTHYSIVKAANILGIGIKEHEDGSGLHILGTDENGHILLDQLWNKLLELIEKRIHNIIIVGNAGTTMLGSVDDIPAMNKIISDYRKSFPATNFHFHIDAAFGGFIIPFIDGLPEIGFNNSCVDSITIDAHKMGLAPYGSGIILARHGLFERTITKADYVPGDDCTLCGSRAGVMALSCWAVMKSLGKEGYAAKAKRVMYLSRYIQKRFNKMGVETFDNDINIIAVKEPLPEPLDEEYITHAHNDFPVDMARPKDSSKMTIWNFVVMDHTKKEFIDTFFKELKRARK